MVKQLTTPEIRKLVRAHNVVMSINIPPKSTRAQIIALIQKKGYTINHEQKRLEKESKKKTIKVTLAGADKVLKKPEKTALQKQKTAEAITSEG